MSLERIFNKLNKGKELNNAEKHYIANAYFDNKLDESPLVSSVDDRDTTLLSYLILLIKIMAMLLILLAYITNLLTHMNTNNLTRYVKRFVCIQK